MPSLEYGGPGDAGGEGIGDMLNDIRSIGLWAVVVILGFTIGNFAVNNSAGALDSTVDGVSDLSDDVTDAIGV